jgi:hypothetical protein
MFAVAYFMLLVLVAGVSIVISFNSMDSFVLGTELNTNGLVEYLCLGKGCEFLP